MQTADRVLSVPRARPVVHPYAQIAAHFQGEIRALRLVAGGPFPSISKIAEDWGVSAPTAQRAVNLLREGGWVRTEHGIGTFVADHPPL